MELRKHQKEFVDRNPDYALLAWEMRVGKQLPACIWSNHPKRNSNPIIVCLKQSRDDWKKDAPHATVYSKEEFKKYYKNIKDPSCLVIDEAHTTASPLFTKARSQLSTAIYTFIRTNPKIHVLLLTATPIRNDPSSLHTLLCYRGVFIPWKEWRDKFYSLEFRPFLRFPAYFPKPTWRTDIRPILEKYSDIVSLRDCVGELPPETVEIIKVKTPKYKAPIGELTKWTDEHQHEQTLKADEIKKLGYRKLIIACHYTAQIDSLANELGKDREVFVLDGRTKNPGEIKRLAQASDECYFIVQASMGMGFDGYMFPALVFASMSHKSVDHTQMKGRLRSLEDLHPVVYYYLIGGKWDQRIYDCIMVNRNFDPHWYLQNKQDFDILDKCQDQNNINESGI
jgi:hypothetical protein